MLSPLLNQTTSLLLFEIHTLLLLLCITNSQSFMIACYSYSHLCLGNVRKQRRNVTFGSRSVWSSTGSWSAVCSLPVCVVQSNRSFNLSPCLLSPVYNDMAEQWCTYVSYMSLCDDIWRRAPCSAGLVQCDWSTCDALCESCGWMQHAADCWTAWDAPACRLPVRDRALWVWCGVTETWSWST